MSNDAEMPGAWVCSTCGFTLQKSVLHVKDGSVRADNSPLNNVCPNDGKLMRPMTWREANEGIFNAYIKAMKQLDWLDRNCSFVADAGYNLGPFKIGELRKLADAGIAEDARREMSKNITQIKVIDYEPTPVDRLKHNWAVYEVEVEMSDGTTKKGTMQGDMPNGDWAYETFEAD